MIDEVKLIMRGLRDSEECWIGGSRDLNVEIGVPGVETDKGDGSWTGAQRYCRKGLAYDLGEKCGELECLWKARQCDSEFT